MMLNCRALLLFAAITRISLVKCAVTPKEVMIGINTMKWLHLVHDKFLSFTLHPRHLLFSENLGTESSNMARGLAPAFVRVGGPETDLLHFTETSSTDKKISVSESQWRGLNRFITDCNLDLIVCLNPLQRVNGVWDSRSTLELISMSNRNGYNLTWQLGFEAQKLQNIDEGVTGGELGRDVVRLRKILDSFPRYREAEIIGPDITSMKSYEDVKFIKDYLMEAGNALSAITWHPQFAEANADEEDLLQSLSMVYNGLDALLYGKDQIPKASQYLTEKPMWIAESQSHCYDGEFSDAIIWIRRLGTAARLGFYVFMHHIQEPAFNYPTPDFWVSLLYKNLVGRAILDTHVVSGNRSALQVFSHCTAVEEIPISPIIAEGYGYERGAVTLFGSNSLNEPVKISLMSLVKNEKINIYILTGGGEAGSRTTLLNGQKLSLSPNGDLPVILPKVRNTNRNIVYVVPPKSVFFIVFPEARVRTCSAYPGTIIEETNNMIKRFKQGKNNNVVQDVTESIWVKDDNGESSSEFKSKETYVKFIDTTSGDSVIKSVKTIRGRSSGPNPGQRYNVGKGKSNILKNKPIKYINRIDDLRQSNKYNSPKQEDITSASVKYVTFSDSSWLPTLSQSNYSKTSMEEIIQTLNNKLNSFTETSNSTTKSLQNLEENERREKYSILASAIFGKRNASSAEVKSGTFETDKDLMKGRWKRYTGEQNYFAAPRLQILNKNPMPSNSENLRYTMYPVQPSNQNYKNKRKLDKMLLNKMETSDEIKLGTVMENKYSFPTENIYIKAEDRDFMNKQPINNKDMFREMFESIEEAGSTENGYYPGEFYEVFNYRPNLNNNYEVKNVGELSEVELNTMSRRLGNYAELPEEESSNINIVTEKCCNDTRDKEIKALLSQKLLTYNKIPSYTNFQSHDYFGGRESEIKKKEDNIWSGVLNKQANIEQFKIENETPVSGVLYLPWETPRREIGVKGSKYGEDWLKTRERVRRAIIDREDPTNHTNNEDQRSYQDGSDEEQITQLLKQITDDGERLLDVLANGQKDPETGENRALYTTHKNILSVPTENVLLTDVTQSTIVPETLVVSSKNPDLENQTQTNNYDPYYKPTLVFVQNDTTELSEMKTTDKNDKENLEEKYSSSDSLISSSTTTKKGHSSRNPKTLIINSIDENEPAFENKSYIAYTSDNSKMQIESSIDKINTNDMSNDTKQLTEESNYKTQRALKLNLDENYDIVEVTEGLKDDQNSYSTSVFPREIKVVASEVQSDTNMKKDSSIKTFKGNTVNSKLIESQSENVNETEDVTMKISDEELTTRSNFLKLPVTMKNGITPKNSVSKSTQQGTNNNAILTTMNETIMKQLDKTNRQKRRNEQIESLRSRLIAYREHLNELTKKRLIHKREVDINYYNKNHILKKDNPNKFETVLNKPRMSDQFKHRFNSPKIIDLETELDILFEPKSSKPLNNHLLDLKEKRSRKTDIDIVIKLPSKSLEVSSIDNDIQNLVNKDRVKPDVETFHSYKYGSKMTDSNRKYNIETNGEELQESYLSKTAIAQSNSNRPEINENTLSRIVGYIDNMHKMPFQNNNNIKSYTKMSNLNRINPHQKRSLDQFHTDEAEKNSIDYWISRNGISDEILPTHIEDKYNLGNTIPEFIGDSNKRGLSKMKNIANEYIKKDLSVLNGFLNNHTTHDETIENTEAPYVKEVDKNYKSNDQQKLQNTSDVKNKKLNINENEIDNTTVKTMEQEALETQTSKYTNRTFVDLIKDGFSYLINQIRNIFFT